MKFTRNTINLAVMLIILSSLINLCVSVSEEVSKKRKLISLNRKSRKQSYGGGNIYYLDRQNVSCPAKTALDGFKLYRPSGSTLAYKFSCRTKCSGIKSGKTYKAKTKPSFISRNKKRSANYLDRHYVRCKVGYALRQFRMGRSGSKIFYNYICTAVTCKSRPTTFTRWRISGKNQIKYLDRQNVRMQSHHVITGFKLEARNNKKFRYR